MDYHAVHGHDVASFGTPLTHRVLTVSAAEADEALSQSSASSGASEPATSTRFLSTGITSLDAYLSGVTLPSETEEGGDAPVATRPQVEGSQQEKMHDGQPSQTQTASSQQVKRAAHLAGGIRKGLVTEIWGPPGAGKTTFGMQLAANALCDGSSSVVWVDCFQALDRSRLTTMIEAQQTQQTTDDDPKPANEDSLAHYRCLSLPHFIALLCAPPPGPPSCLRPDTSLLVIDSLSALVNYSLPRMVERKPGPLMANGKAGPTPYEKRTQVLQYIIIALERLAETNNIAIVLLTQCASRFQAEKGASLVPAINASVWDHGISARLVLFRDWAWKDDRPVGGRFVGVQKRNGTGGHTTMEYTVAFGITEEGLVEEHYSAMPLRSEAGYKRKLGDAGLGGRSVDDENYGWDDNDDNMPRMPPQWQGSEDLLLGNRDEEEEEEEEDEEESIGKEGEKAEKEKEVDDEDKAAEDDGPRTSQTRSIRSPRSIADSEEDDSDM